MNPMHQDGRESWAELLDGWGGQNPPEGFARNVAHSAQAERSTRGTRWSGRGIVVPLLLAAFLVSLGAAAAFSQRTKSTERSPVQAFGVEGAGAKNSKVEKSPRLSFYLSGEEGRAERETSVEVEPLAPKRSVPVSTSSEEEEVLEARPPPVVHLPRCECGTSGVVCTCSE